MDIMNFTGIMLYYMYRGPYGHDVVLNGIRLYLSVFLVLRLLWVSFVLWGMLMYDVL